MNEKLIACQRVFEFLKEEIEKKKAANYSLAYNLEEIQRNLLREVCGVEVLTGDFEEVYPAAASVFSSLPPIEKVRAALWGRPRALKMWVKKEQSYKDCDAVEMEITDTGDYFAIRFVTPTSGRVVKVFRYSFFDKITAEVHFGGSVVAASDVIKNLRYYHPQTNAQYTTTVDGLKSYKVRDIQLSDADILYVRRYESAEESRKWYEYKGDYMHLSHHAPEWAHEYLKDPFNYTNIN